MTRALIERGIRFECTQCGACCTGAPGTVYVGRDEVDALARFLGHTPDALIAECLVPFEDGYTIRERPGHDCWFLQDRMCTVHPVRPLQCRHYPFWVQTLRSAEAWAQTRRDCPGIGQGPLHGPEEILRRLHGDRRLRSAPDV